MKDFFDFPLDLDFFFATDLDVDLRCLLDFPERARLDFLVFLEPFFFAVDPPDFLDLVVKVTRLPLAMNETLVISHRDTQDNSNQIIRRTHKTLFELLILMLRHLLPTFLLMDPLLVQSLIPY